MGRELALCYEEKRQVYRRRGALGGQEELFKPAGMVYPLVDAPIRSTVVLDQKLIVLQRTLSSQL